MAIGKSNFTLETIRQLGICNHYNRLIDSGKSEDTSLYDTSVFARIGQTQTKKILHGQTANSKKFGGIWGSENIAKLIGLR